MPLAAGIGHHHVADADAEPLQSHRCGALHAFDELRIAEVLAAPPRSAVASGVASRRVSHWGSALRTLPGGDAA